MPKIKNFIVSRYKKLMCKKRYFVSLMFSAFFMFAPAMPVHASGINNSKLVTGTEKLIGDVTTWLMVLAPIVAGLLIIYFCIRRSAADEMDQKKWNTRIIAATLTQVMMGFGVSLIILIPTGDKICNK